MQETIIWKYIMKVQYKIIDEVLHKLLLLENNIEKQQKINNDETKKKHIKVEFNIQNDMLFFNTKNHVRHGKVYKGWMPNLG